MADLRAVLTDKLVDTLPLATQGQYVVRDTDLKGFHLLVGMRRKSYAVQGENWRNGQRTACRLTLGRADELAAREARLAAKTALVQIAKGEIEPKRAKPQQPAPHEVTLAVAWARYRQSHMIRKGRSEATISGYRDHVERILADWLDTPLRDLAENPRLVAQRHDELTHMRGPYAANGAMRSLRAIYNHARKTERALPADNPTYGVDWNREIRRNTAMGVADLPRWFAEAGRLRHQIRREFHLFMLLSGSRPGALMKAKIEHLDLGRRVLHIPRPKGGEARAFDIPLSRAMICSLMRAMRIGRILHPDNAATWIFAADSAEGHLVEHKEPREKLSRFILRKGRPVSDQPTARRWPSLPSRRIGHPALDPTPLDPRVAMAYSRDTYSNAA